MSLARAIYEGEEFALEDVADRVFTCTSCGNCERVCPIGLSPQQVNLSLRELLVDNNAVPRELMSRRSALLSGTDTTSYYAADSTGKDTVAVPIEETLDLVDVLFLPGCDAACDIPSEARDCLQIIQSINPATTVLGSRDKCCGAALLELGFKGDGKSSQRALGDEINVFPRLTTIIHMTPKCQQQLADDARVVSFPGWLLALVENDEVRINPKSQRPKISYLNTCNSGAWNNEALALLKTCGVAISNTNAGAGLTMCCGAGGGMPTMAPDSAARMANANLVEFADSADCGTVTVIADPNCLAHLSRSANSDAPANQILGLAGFLKTFFEFSRR